MSTQADHDKPKVLLVEDEERMIPLMQKVLSRAGFDVTTVKRADEAIALLSRQQFSWVVTDRGLEDGSTAGISFIDHMLSHHPQTPLVLVTGNPEDAKRELAEVGASQVQVIAKPDIISPLMEASQQVMQGSFPVAKRGDVVTTNTPADANVGPPRFGASSVLDEARPGGFMGMHAPRAPVLPSVEIKPFGQGDSGRPGDGKGSSPFR